MLFELGCQTSSEITCQLPSHAMTGHGDMMANLKTSCLGERVELFMQSVNWRGQLLLIAIEWESTTITSNVLGVDYNYDQYKML